MADYFVSAYKGDDLNDGLSWENAFMTIEKSGTEVSPGDTVYLAVNEYHDPIGDSGVFTDGCSLTGLRYGAETTESTDYMAVIKANSAIDELVRIDITSDGKLSFSNIEFDGNGYASLPYNSTNLGANADNNITVDNCRFKGLEYIQNEAILDYYPIGVYSNCIFYTCSIDTFKLSQCIITITDCKFEISSNPSISIVNLKNGTYATINQTFTRCIFYYSGGIADRNYKSSIIVDGRNTDVVFDECTFDSIFSIISTASNDADIIVINSIMLNMYSRYLSDTHIDPIYMQISDTYWYNSPDNASTYITDGGNVINSIPELDGGRCIPFENTEIGVIRYQPGYIDINGNWVDGYPEKWIAIGSKQPLTGKEYDILIEGGLRLKQPFKVYTCSDLELSDTQEGKNPDKITIEDEVFQVIKSYQWQSFGRLSHYKIVVDRQEQPK